MNGLPLDVLSLIANRLVVKDWYCFIRTCKKVYRASELTRKWLSSSPPIPHLRKTLFEIKHQPYQLNISECLVFIAKPRPEKLSWIPIRDQALVIGLRSKNIAKMSMYKNRCIVCHDPVLNDTFIRMYNRDFYICNRPMCEMAFWMSAK